MGKPKTNTGKKNTGSNVSPGSNVSRKQLRKEKRLLKKKGKCIFYEKLKRKREIPSNSSIHPVNSSPEKRLNTIKKSVSPNITATVSKTCEGTNKKSAKKVTFSLPSQDHDVTSSGVQASSTSPKKNLKDKLINQMKTQRKRQLLDAVKEDEKEIKILEKRLKLNRRKNKSTSRGFVECGLDYILEACDPDRIKSDLNTENYFDESDSDFTEDISYVQGKDLSKPKSKDHDQITKYPSEESLDPNDKKERGSNQQSNDAEIRGESDLHSTDSENGDDSYFSGSDCCDNDGNEEDEISSNSPEKTENKCWEDIYGRLRDAKGNIIKVNQGKYIPPHLRISGNSEIDKAKKQLKGLLNRLAQSNLLSIANEIETLYSKHSRHAINESIIDLILKNLVTRVLSPERLIIDHAMLIALLHANIGSEIGAYMLQRFVEYFHSMLSQGDLVENKELDNILYLISYMYNFNIFESCLMYDILNKLSDCCSEKNVDLILVVLRSVGFALRKKDPNAMKQFLLSVQKKCNQLSAEDNSRMKYMLSVLVNIKNNNISKLSEFDPSQHEQSKNVLKSLIRKGNSVVSLRIGLDDLLNVEERGRWWLVGSAWKKDDNNKVVNETKRDKYSTEMLELAKKHKMNTDNRRNIFCILMTAVDYQDAFEKILRLGLKGQQEREIPLVIVHCLLQERHYNPYYALIADQLCLSNRRHQMTLQCALWDRFKDLQSLSPSQIHLLAQFLAQMFIAGSLSISVLKVVEFAELDKHHIRLLRQTILSIANEKNDDNIKNVFVKVAKSKKLLLFREALKLFLHHFILRNMEEGDLKDKVNRISNMLIDSGY